jgi:hypothetical protein
MRKQLLLIAGLLAFAGFTAQADEGMWTYNQFPANKVAAAYGFAPDAEWLKNLQLASVRIAGGCSASVVSPTGLVMTNHHCARECIQNVSGLRKKDFNKDGFISRKSSEEARCPGMEMNQLTSISDVTQALQEATKGSAPERFSDVQKAAIADIEKSCATGDEWRCEVVTLYRGGQYNLYKYRRLQDIRLVFAPEDAIAFFGGDPDNFNFPRYNLDVTFLRIYGADGKPWKSDAFLPFSKTGVKEGELTFVSGNPGSTSRGMTMAQMQDQRDSVLPAYLMDLSHTRGWITEYQQRGKEQLRHSNDDLFGIENSLKALKGQHESLADAGFMAQLHKDEADFRRKVVNSPQLMTDYGDVWDNISALTLKAKKQRGTLDALTDTHGSVLMDIARAVLRHPVEMRKPNGERLVEFTDARLPQLVQAVLSNAPIYKELEIAKITYGLTQMREKLSPDHLVVKKLLGNKSPQQVARALVRGTRLQELKSNAKGEAIGGLRKKLWDADADTVAASQDPLLKFVASYDAEVRAARKKFEEEVQGPLKRQEERLAQARFAVYGNTSYPDATFTLRLSYGRVVGWDENGTAIAPFTDFAGAYKRHTGADPFALPATWLKARGKINPNTPFNFVTNNDIIGGNSGSPMVNQKGEVVGLVFDGNIHSLGGEFGFDARLNRTVAVHSQALLEALDKVYPAGHIAAEIRAGQR